MATDRLLLEQILAGVSRIEERIESVDSRVTVLEHDKTRAAGMVAGGKLVYTVMAAVAGGLVAVGAYVIPQAMASVAPSPSVSVSPPLAGSK